MEAIPSLPFTISRREFASKQVANGVCVEGFLFFFFFISLGSWQERGRTSGQQLS